MTKKVEKRILKQIWVKKRFVTKKAVFDEKRRYRVTMKMK